MRGLEYYTGPVFEADLTLVNRSAETLLAAKEKTLSGQPLAKAIPEFGPLLKRAQKLGRRLVTDQVALRRRGAEYLAVCAAAYRAATARIAAEGLSVEQLYHGPSVALDDRDALICLDGGGPAADGRAASS